ncbi:aldo/keto reductase [Streptacidiphilus monticola]|uniref:Aldo/keto reductase n=1 Tax=Streptacidiphilus monticola TaxID=2161674 RepID=A0ABW1FW10_9ACTN
MTRLVPEVTLNNGVKMPQLGLGVFQVPNDTAADIVARALEVGYRAVDTAAAYRNEKGTGQAIAASGIPREKLFVTTKLWNDNQGYDSTMRAFDTSLAQLGLEYVDLYLIHWPCPKQDKYLDTWKAFERIYADGRARAIGVSNFEIAHLERLAEASEITPAVNQIELHPRLPQRELSGYLDGQGIACEAWSPLGQGTVLDDPVLKTIAEKHGKTPAQVVLRWHLDADRIVIPKTVTPARLKENLDVFDFILDRDDRAAISALGSGDRIGPNPNDFG